MSGDDRGNFDESRSDSRERLMRGRQRPVDVDDEDEFLANSGDLRYEGPITFEDEEDGELRADGGGGKVFLTATLIGAAVILLIGVALWLRRDGDTSTSSLSAQVRPAPATQDAPRVSQSPALADRAALPPGVASPLDGATRGTDPAELAVERAPRPESKAQDAPLQSASEIPAAGTPAHEPAIEPAREPATERATLAEPPLERPAPRPASTALEERAAEPVREPVKKTAAKPAVETRAAKPAETPGVAKAEPAPKPAKVEKVAKSEPRAEPAKVEKAAKAEPRPEPAPAEAGSVHALVAAGKLRAAAQAGLQRAHAGKGYTLQLLYACSQETVTRAFGAVGDEKLFLVPAANSKKSCYRLMWGQYPSHDGAVSAASSVPDYFRAHKADKPIPVALDKLAGS